MNDDKQSTDRLQQVRDTLRKAREQGAEVVVRRKDGTVESVRHIRRLPSGDVEWTEPADPKPNDAA